MTITSSSHNTTPYPPGLTGESAYYAMFCPPEYRADRLIAIIDACEGHPSQEAAALSMEAQDFLDELEN